MKKKQEEQDAACVEKDWCSGVDPSDCHLSATRTELLAACPCLCGFEWHADVDNIGGALVQGKKT
jgi:hypothetical protein